MVDIHAYILLFFIWLISTIIVKALVRNRTTICLPPSPLKLPLIGHLHLLSNKPHESLHKLSNKYGPIFHLFLGSIPCVVASSPKIVKQFLKNNEIIFSNRPKISNIDYLTYHQDFSFAPYGPYWKFMKKLCISKLLGGQTLHLLLPFRRDEIKRLIKVLSRNAAVGNEVNIRGEITTMTNNVITRMLMSKGCCENEHEAEKVRKMILEMAKLSGKFNLSDIFWFFKKWDLQGFGKKLKGVRDKFDEIMDSIIEEHQEIRRKRQKMNDGDQEVAKDLLEILLDNSEDNTSEIRLTRENIKAFVLDLFSGGTDTSAIAMEWALAELINHPNIMEKAAQEIDNITGKTRLVQESDISQLPYLQAIVKETLRLHSPAPMILRESSEDCTIEGYHVPAKTRLFVNVWAMNRDPKYWENPLEFRPERFMNETKILDVRGQNNFHYLPFGCGRRGCPGISLALQILHTSLAAIIQCFEWKVGGEGNNNGKVDMEEGSSVTVPRANPLVCVPVARFNPTNHELN
ncbi:PREDICTED: cytochrome P450 93A3-like [Nicotiana attenuata]|nr:PREDICTED: cytochrome P450 93A3-like [Nicotiana attenuata]